jgi:hypothetical protein
MAFLWDGLLARLVRAFRPTPKKFYLYTILRRLRHYCISELNLMNKI